MIKPLDYAKELIAAATTKLDVTVDATCGTGKDSLFLASISKKVYSFDIQEIAIEKSMKLFKGNEVKNIELIKDSHENILNYVEEKISGIIFNLGYLHDGDKEICTKANTTLKAVEKSLSILKIKGLCLIIINSLHNEGKQEKAELINFSSSLNENDYQVMMYNYLNKKDSSSLMVIERLR